MPSQRAPGQKLLTLPASEEFIAALDDALRELGYSNRSEFIRQAILEKLASLRIKIDRSLVAQPARYPSHRAETSFAAETNSAPPSPKTVEEAEARALELERAREQTHAVAVPIFRAVGRGRKKQRPGEA